MITATQRAHLAAGLRWLFDTVQPDDAWLQHHGWTAPADPESERQFSFVPRGYNGGPVIVMDVAPPRWPDTDPRHQGLLVNGYTATEHQELVDVLADLGYEVGDRWNGGPGSGTGSVLLVGDAHKSLLAAVGRYHDGCPDHAGSVFCSCGWYERGYRRVVFPDPADLTPG